METNNGIQDVAVIGEKYSLKVFLLIHLEKVQTINNHLYFISQETILFMPSMMEYADFHFLSCVFPILVCDTFYFPFKLYLFSHHCIESAFQSIDITNRNPLLESTLQLIFTL